MTEKEPIYNPKIIPDDFMSEINNKFFTLVLGTTFIYEAETEDGMERIEVYVTNKTKVVLEVSIKDCEKGNCFVDGHNSSCYSAGHDTLLFRSQNLKIARFLA